MNDRLNLAALVRVVTLLLALTWALPMTADQNAARGQGPQSLTVALDDNYPPYSFRDPNGTLKGYLVDLWDLWSAQTGVAVKLEASNWAAAKERMAQGRADVIDTLFDTRGRRKWLDYTAPYADIPVAIHVHQDIAGITDLGTLSGFLIGVKAGDACAEHLDAAGVTNQLPFDSYQALIDAALRDEVKVFCLDEPPAQFLLYQAGAHAHFRNAFILYTGQFHRAVRRGDQATLDLIEHGFAAIPGTEVQALRDKWLGGPVGPATLRLRHLAPALGILTIGALLLGGFNVLLRRQVRSRTADLNQERTRLDAALTQLRSHGRELAESEARFRAFFEQAAVGVAEVETASGRFMRINPRYCEILGRDAAEILGTGFLGVTHPDDLTNHTDGMRDLMAGKARTFSLEKRYLRPDGGVVWVQLEVSALWPPGSEPDFHLTIARDITQRKAAEQSLMTAQAELQRLLEESDRSRLVLLSLIEDQKSGEAALRASEARYRTLFDGSKVPMLLVDPTDGALVDANRAAASYYGWSRKAMRRMHISDINMLSPDEIQAEVTLAKAGRRSHFNFRHRLASGEVRQVEVHSGPLDVDGRGLLYSIVHDITARRQAEDQLHKLSLAVEQSPVSVVITDLEGRIEYVNQAFIDNSGYSRDEAIGQNPRILQAGKTPKETYTALWDTLERGETWSGQFVNQTKYGEEYIEFAQVTPIRQADGTVTHYLGIKENITERKRIGEELDRYRYRLEALVEERTAQLSEAQHRAEAANLAKSAFLANMSHEIRTPMNAILGLTHLARRAGAPPGLAERLEKIDNAAHHLLGIINDILDLSKIEAGHLVLEQTEFALAPLVLEVRDLIAEPAQRKGLTLSVETADLPPLVRGDPTRLRQTLLNYASNAVKFTQSGSVTLAAHSVDEGPDGLLLRCEVRDTGPGIAQDQQERLFGAFEQADVTTTRSHGGTGLGLAIARRLATLMGGEAGVVSTLGSGSTFWFTARLGRAVPALDPVSQAPTTADPEASLKGLAGSRLLLVEDNPINREVALELLGAVGLAADTATDGLEAVARASTHNYDLILMDVQMPCMDGLEATRTIRALPAGGTVPILAMTAGAFEEDRSACLTAGMNDFVPKPVDPQHLYATLARWLAQPAPSSAKPVTPAPPDPEPDLPERLAAIPGLNLDLGLRAVRGNADRYAKLLALFADMHGPDTKRLEEQLLAGDTEAMRRGAHSLKGAAGTLGLVKVQQAAQALDQAVRDGAPTDTLSPALVRLTTEMDTLIAAIRALDT